MICCKKQTGRALGTVLIENDRTGSGSALSRDVINGNDFACKFIETDFWKSPDGKNASSKTAATSCPVLTARVRWWTIGNPKELPR